MARPQAAGPRYIKSKKNFPHQMETIMATEVTGKMEFKEPLAFGRGRQSLEQSVWYSGWLLTFLATGQDTQGQFALQEQVGRKGNVPPPHIHHREDETFYVLEGEMTFSIGDRTIKATPGTMVFAPRIWRPLPVSSTR